MNEALFLVAQCKIVIPEIMYKKITNCTQLCKCMCVCFVCVLMHIHIYVTTVKEREAVNLRV